MYIRIKTPKKHYPIFQNDIPLPFSHEEDRLQPILTIKKIMPNFNRNQRTKSEHGRKKFGNRDGGRPAMHRATCAECGESCSVPFKPAGDRPVYCSNCFRNSEEPSSKRSDRDFARPGMHQATCDECGQRCEVPFRPTGEKPVYCSQCFKKGSHNNNSNRNTDQWKEQFEIMNTKLDKLLKLFTPTVPEPKKPEEIKEKKTAKPKKSTKKTSKKQK